MNISHRHAYLYFVIPKCGSASVRHALQAFTDEGYPVTDTVGQHVPFDRFWSHYPDAEKCRTYTKFTFVRNPYDRVFSAFLQDFSVAQRYEAWSRLKSPIFDVTGNDYHAYLQNHVARADLRSGEWMNFCPMVAFTHDQGRYALDWFGRAETLDDDVQRLGELLGVAPAPVARYNDLGGRIGVASAEGKYLKYYARDTVALVNDLYRADFEAFGYTQHRPDDFPIEPVEKVDLSKLKPR